MNQLRNKLKLEYKHNLSDGLKIYYSKNRPINQIFNSLKNKENSFICPFNDNILITYNKLNTKECYDLELKEFDFNFMDFNKEGFIIVDFVTLFDILSLDLLELLKPYNATIKQITPLFKNCLNVDDYINKANSIIREYFNNGAL